MKIQCCAHLSIVLSVFSLLLCGGKGDVRAEIA